MVRDTWQHWNIDRRRGYQVRPEPGRRQPGGQPRLRDTRPGAHAASRARPDRVPLAVLIRGRAGKVCLTNLSRLTPRACLHVKARTRTVRQTVRQTRERRRSISPAALRRVAISVLIAGAFLFPGAARCAQQFGEDRDRSGIFDPLRQSLPQSRAARVLRARPAYRHPFLCAQRSARRAPRSPRACRIGPHLFRSLSPTAIVSRGVSPPSDHSKDSHHLQSQAQIRTGIVSIGTLGPAGQYHGVIKSLRFALPGSALGARAGSARQGRPEPGRCQPGDRTRRRVSGSRTHAASRTRAERVRLAVLT
jgi:hypothetical protein